MTEKTSSLDPHEAQTRYQEELCLDKQPDLLIHDCVLWSSTVVHAAFACIKNVWVTLCSEGDGYYIIL